MANNKLKVSTKYNSARQKEQKIINFLIEHPDGETPKNIAFYIGEKESTVKSVLKRLELRRVIKRHEKLRGYYILVENHPHGILSWNFQNLVLILRIKEIKLKDDYSETFSLDNFAKFDLSISQKTRKAVMVVSSDYPPNIGAIRLIFYFFQRRMGELYGFSPLLDKMWVTTFELNKDDYSIRIDGAKCITARCFLADLKLYDKGKCMRKEHKPKISIRADLMLNMIDHGNQYAGVMAVAEGNQSKINKVEKIIKKKFRNDNRLFEEFVKLKEIVSKMARAQGIV